MRSEYGVRMAEMTEILFPLQRDLPLWERTYHALERLIIHRELAPGTRLAENELAEQLGVSRSPIREALRALETAGWVEVQPRRGAFVTVPGPHEGDHLFEVRSIFEPRAAALAAERITPDTLEQLERLTQQGFAAAERGDGDAVVELNALFHRAVFAATGNRVLTDTLLNLEKKSMWHFSTIATARGVDSWHEHTTLLEALAAGDADTASAEMEAHVRASWDSYRRAAEEGSTEVG
jgi:DNA-binding GntR family transcriptional regulator